MPQEILFKSFTQTFSPRGFSSTSKYGSGFLFPALVIWYLADKTSRYTPMSTIARLWKYLSDGKFPRGFCSTGKNIIGFLLLSLMVWYFINSASIYVSISSMAKPWRYLSDGNFLRGFCSTDKSIRGFLFLSVSMYFTGNGESIYIPVNSTAKLWRTSSEGFFLRGFSSSSKNISGFLFLSLAILILGNGESRYVSIYSIAILLKSSSKRKLSGGFCSFSNFGSGFLFLALVMWCLPLRASAYGSVSSIAGSSGSEAMFCAIDASGKQQIMCWGKNQTSTFTDASSSPSFATVAGGNGFMCGLSSQDFRPLCWEHNKTGMNLVPYKFQGRRYSEIAPGQNHVCGIRSYLDSYPGTIDCWRVVKSGNVNASPYAVLQVPNKLFQSIVAGDDFSCGVDQVGLATCWGSQMLAFNITPPSDVYFHRIAAGSNYVCGIVKKSFDVHCWGDDSMKQASPPNNIQFMFLTTGLYHSCGIKRDDHGVVCWGNFNETSIPKGVGFLALASSNNVTCGIREDNLLLDCWGNGADFSPPLQLCSPGLCRRDACSIGEFFFNISSLGLQDLNSLCVHKDEQICSPCANACSPGTFLSNYCTESADRICTDCSLCQNSTCDTICKNGQSAVSPYPSPFPSNSTSGHNPKHRKLTLVGIIGVSISGGFVLVFVGCFLPLLLRGRAFFCLGKNKIQNPANSSNNAQNISSGFAAPWVSKPEFIQMQAFRYTELRDATNGFKELNELGRGSYGFVYKAVLPDGRQVAVKRANAARRIQHNSRDFEAEIEVICKLHHSNLVNLLGYCEEMGERLLVYEFMPHGTLHDHLHGGLSPLSWNLRIRVSMQAARGIEYLHKDALPPIVHKDVKTSNILLDAEWGARVADFGLTILGEKSLLSSTQKVESVYTDPEYFNTQSFTEKSDVYSFGVVLLEILTGRKAHDTDFDPPNIVEWAVPLIAQGNAAAILDQSIDLPRNVEPLLRMADIAELSVRKDPNERPTITDVAAWLEQLVRASS